MARLVIRRFIRATPEQVWEVVSDLESQAQWMVDVRSLDIISERKEGLGTVLDLQTELFGVPLLHDVMEITEWEPPSRIGVTHRGQFHGSGSFQFDREADGTVFTWEELFEPPLGPLGEIAYSLAVKSHLRSVWSKSLANVARLIESSSSKAS